MSLKSRVLAWFRQPPSPKDIYELPPWIWKARWWLLGSALMVVPTNVVSGIQLHNPFMFLSLGTATFYIFLTINRRTFRSTSEYFTYVDMFRVGTLYFIGNMDLLIVHAAVIGTGVTYVVSNMLFVRRMRMAIIIGLYFLLPVGMLFYQPLSAIQSMLVAIHGTFLAVVVVLIEYIRSREARDQHQRMEQFQREAARSHAILELNKVSEALLIHDARNLLQRLSVVEIEHKKGLASDAAVSVVREVQERIQPTLDLLSNLSRTPIDLKDFILRMTVDVPAVTIVNQVPPDVRVTFNLRLLESIVGNLVRNAREATGGSGVTVKFQYASGALTIEDDAGGFDPETLVAGVSTKPGGQGRFLTTLLKYQNAMGLQVNLERHPKGMRFNLCFLESVGAG